VGCGVQLGPRGTGATNGLLCQHRVIMMMDKLVEWLAWETEVLGENLPPCRFVHHKPHMLPVREPGPPRWEASDQPLELRHGRIHHPFSLRLLRLSSDSPGGNSYNISNYATTASFNIVSNLLFTNHLTVQRYAVSATDSVVKQIIEDKSVLN
jgi:hypothetical protein